MKFLAKPAVNTGRQAEADLAKFVCLMGMVVVHCFDTFVSFSETSTGLQFLFIRVLNCIFGAGTFMFCMGIGLAYTSHDSPKLIMKRGVRIFLLGYLLNILCGAVYLLILGNAELALSAVLGLDILQFAGLALLLFGLLKHLRCPDWGVGVIALALSVIGSLIQRVDVGSAGADLVLGLFVGTFDPEWMLGGIFPLFNWFVFVAAGDLFAVYLLRPCRNKTRLYLPILAGSAAVLAGYLILAIPSGYGMMGSVLRFYHLRTHEALVCLAGALFALSVYHLICTRLPGAAVNFITGVSKNINGIYCIQWIVIGLVYSLWRLGGGNAPGDGAIILIGLAIFAAAAALAHLFRRVAARKKRA